MDLFLSFVFLTNYHLCMLYLCAWLMDFLDFFRLVNRFMLFLTIEGLDVGFFFFIFMTSSFKSLTGGCWRVWLKLMFRVVCS